MAPFPRDRSERAGFDEPGTEIINDVKNYEYTLDVDYCGRIISGDWISGYRVSNVRRWI